MDGLVGGPLLVAGLGPPSLLPLKSGPGSCASQTQHSYEIHPINNSIRSRTDLGVA